MTKRTIDRLGAMSYGALILGIINGSVQSGANRQTIHSLPILIPLLVINVAGVIAAFYCLFCFISHLFMENRHVGGAGKALWLVLLLLGHLMTMPVYWYLYLVRDRLADEVQALSGSGTADSATRSLV